MRAVFAWVLTLTCGFSALLALGTLALLPSEAAKSRAVYRVVDRYAHQLAQVHQLPRNEQVDDSSASKFEGVRVWPSSPGGCRDVPVGTSSDRFEVGFWQNGADDRFGSKWWHCYAYPSRKTTLQLSVWDYLRSDAGQQVAAYAIVALIAGILAWSLGTPPQWRPLKPATRTTWFVVLFLAITFFDALQDSGDDQFHENPDFIKWFVFVFENAFPWLLLASCALLLVSFVRNKRSSLPDEQRDAT